MITNTSISSSIRNAQPKVESLIRKFDEYGLSQDSLIDEEFIKKFLDTNTNNQLEPNVINKLIDTLNFTENNKITVANFINGYIEFEKNMNIRAGVIKDKVSAEQKNYDDCQEKLREYQNEALDEEGLCENAEITITLDRIEMYEDINDIQKMIIEFDYNGQQESVEFDINNNIHDLNHVIKFKPKHKKDTLDIKLYSEDYDNQRKLLGLNSTELEPQETQSEYSMNIEFKQDIKDSNISARIEASILFYYSDYKNYEDELNEAENKLNKIQNNYNKLLKIINTIKKLYGLSEIPNDTEPLYEEEISTGRPQIDRNNTALRSKLRKEPKNETKSEPYINTNKNNSNCGFLDVKNTLQQPVQNNNGLYMTLGLIALSGLSAVYKNDFINGLLGTTLYAYYKKELAFTKVKLPNALFWFCIGAIVFNVVWFLLNFNKSSIEYEDNGLRIFTLILTVLISVLEGIIAFSLKNTAKKNDQFV